jgi:hypothetical protein
LADPDPNKPQVRIRLWCDQTDEVALADLSLGIRYISERQEMDYGIRLHGVKYHWRNFTDIERDGELVQPRDRLRTPRGHSPRGRLFVLGFGEFREFSFTLSDAIELDQIGPGSYTIVPHLGKVGTRAQPLRFHVREEGGKLLARVEGPVVSKPTTRATTGPVERPATAPDATGLTAAAQQKVSIRLWCDQSGSAPLQELTFGVRYVGESEHPFPLQIFPPPFHWRQFVQIEEDGRPLTPRSSGLGPDGELPKPTLIMLGRGQAREFTFGLADAIELESLRPGLYTMCVNLGRTPVRTQTVQFEVREEGGSRVARVIAQRLTTQPTTAPVSEREKKNGNQTKGTDEKK